VVDIVALLTRCISFRTTKIMKKLLILIALFGLINQNYAQQLKIAPLFSVSSYQKFLSGLGYGIGYEVYLKSDNKLGFSFEHSINPTDYNYVFGSDADGMDYHRAVKPQNQKFSFSIYYGITVYKSDKSSFYFGPKFGINYFYLNERITERRADEIDTYTCTSKSWKNNKIGLGLVLEYERKVLNDRLSLSFTTEPEFIFLTKFGLVGSSAPPLVGFLTFKLNILFNLQKPFEAKL
jgi:hypothetical protein